MHFVAKKFASLNFIRTFAIPFEGNMIGELAEWSNAAVLKTVDLHGSGGSNPSLSAKGRPDDESHPVFVFSEHIMPIETERKFRVTGDFRPYASKSYRICQGYLSSVPERTVRIRVKADKGYITVKGISSDSGMSRYEWEKEILVEDAFDLLKLCEPGIIDKTRYIVEALPEADENGRTHIFEVDEFHGENEGLVIAEIELSSEDDEFVRPEWLGEELTGDKRYYNSYLSSHPYRFWQE